MGWTSPRTWSVAETPTAANLNTHVRDNLKALAAHATIYHSTTQAITSSYAPVAFDSEDVDTDSFHSTVSNNSRLTAPWTGRYLVGANATVDSTANPWSIKLRVDNTTDIVEGKSGQRAAGNDDTITILRPVTLSIGSYVELWAQGGGSVTLEGLILTVFWIVGIGGA